MIGLEMKNFKMKLTDMQQKILALSSGKIHEYEYLTGEKILPCNQRKLIEQSKFTHSPLGKTNKNDSRARKKKQVNAITNQNGRLAALTNKDDHKNDHRYIHKEYLIKYSEENLMD